MPDAEEGFAIAAIAVDEGQQLTVTLPNGTQVAVIKEVEGAIRYDQPTSEKVDPRTMPRDQPGQVREDRRYEQPDPP